jgi:hypothetical protein
MSDDEWEAQDKTIDDKWKDEEGYLFTLSVRSLYFNYNVRKVLWFVEGRLLHDCIAFADPRRGDEPMPQRVGQWKPHAFHLAVLSDKCDCTIVSPATVIAR